MRIAIDIRCLLEKHYSGVGLYTLNLLHEIFRQDAKNEYVLFYNTAKKARIPEFHYPNVKISGHKIPNKIFNSAVQFLKFPKLDEFIKGADVFFFPNVNFFSFSKKCKVVTTIHDLSFEMYRDFFSFKARLWHKMIQPKLLCQRSDKIIAVSENTKRDIVKLYNIPDEKIQMIYLGIITRNENPDPEKIKKVKEKYRLPEKYVLFIGNLEPRKNIESAIAAFLKSNISKDYFFVLAGAQSWKSSRIHELIKKHFERIHYIGYVEENEKPVLYALASLFVYPSYYEGFGLPPLEAMACGVPTIVSHASSLPEIVGNASILVDPYDVNDIAKAIETAIADNSLRDELVRRGHQRANEFQWEKAARETIDVFQKL